MIKRDLTYNKVIKYFNHLADAQNYIANFVPFSLEDWQSQSRETNALRGFSLVLYAYQATLDGNKQRTFANRTISFAIVKSVAKKNDFKEQYNIIDQAEQIGLSIISRIAHDAKQPENKWLYNNFDKNSVRFLEISGKDANNYFGMEFHLQINVPEPLIIDPKDWIDIETTC